MRNLFKNSARFKDERPLVISQGQAFSFESNHPANDIFANINLCNDHSAAPYEAANINTSLSEQVAVGAGWTDSLIQGKIYPILGLGVGASRSYYFNAFVTKQYDGYIQALGFERDSDDYAIFACTKDVFNMNARMAMVNRSILIKRHQQDLQAREKRMATFVRRGDAQQIGAQIINLEQVGI